MNETNKKIWDDEFSKQPSTSSDDCCFSMDDNGNYSEAIPLGYDDEQKEYSAVKDIIENAIFKKEYKLWKIRSELKDFCTSEPIEPFDVVYCLDESWEYPLFPVIIHSINKNENTVIVKFVDHKEDEVITKVMSIKHNKTVINN